MSSNIRAWCGLARTVQLLHAFCSRFGSPRLVPARLAYLIPTHACTPRRSYTPQPLLCYLAFHPCLVLLPYFTNAVTIPPLNEMVF
ncbi:hypothetical protein BDQ12DRAFT_263179 [Crucibulum laeve]|uniref:Uncharacterized protein n=1 Tax=Crucibulum laeve TaxID=68775 RepID=A0A5C3M4H8_9AGAR|nr:hypothetical protein BDQ12DRAFT_263179 [Crucibulum laeve]